MPSEEVQSVLSTQDILVLPTKSENYGHVVFEALSVGCIPIISDRTPWSLVERWICCIENPRSFFKSLDRISEYEY